MMLIALIAAVDQAYEAATTICCIRSSKHTQYYRHYGSLCSVLERPQIKTLAEFGHEKDADDKNHESKK